MGAKTKILVSHAEKISTRMGMMSKRRIGPLVRQPEVHGLAVLTTMKKEIRYRRVADAQPAPHRLQAFRRLALALDPIAWRLSVLTPTRHESKLELMEVTAEAMEKEAR
jgi:hypothetical protein